MRKAIEGRNGGSRTPRLLKSAGLLLVPGLLLGWAPAPLAGPASGTSATVAEAPAVTPAAMDGVTRLVIGAGSRLWVEGGSTVRSWSCETEQLSGGVDMTEPSTAVRVANLPDRVRGMTVGVPVATLECGNDTMNRHMLDALKATEHGTIRFTMTRSEMVTDGGEGTVMLEGTLRIGGQDQPVLLMGRVADGDAGKVTVKGSYELNMTDYGVRPPRLMMGTMRVHEDVVVHYELVLQQ